MKTLLLLLLAVAAFTCGCEQPERPFVVTYEAQLKSGQISRGSTLVQSKKMDKYLFDKLIHQLAANPAVVTNGVVVIMVVELER